MEILSEDKAVRRGFIYALTTEFTWSEQVQRRVNGSIKSMSFPEWAEAFISWWRERNKDPENDLTVVRLSPRKFVIATKKPIGEDGDNYLSPRVKQLVEALNA